MAGLASKRGFILACAAICCSFTGAVYMWSIFNQPLMDEYGWRVQQVSFAYSLYLIMSGVSGFAGGWLQRRFSSSRLILLAGGMVSAGWFLAGFATTVPMLYLTFAVIGGLGDGLLYNVTVSVATKWFPDKHGFANGICVGAVGMSALFFSPLGNAFIETFSASDSFKLCGAVFAAFFLVFARFAVAPRDGWEPEGWEAPEGSARGGHRVIGNGHGAGRMGKPAERPFTRDSSGSQTLRQPLFWALFVLYVAATTSGTMLTSHTSGIGQSLVGLTPAQGALMIGVLSVGSTAGRFGFGMLSDRAGRFPTMVLMLSVTGASMLALGAVSTFSGLAFCLVVAGACFGGFLTVMPSLCADLFGDRFFGQNYSFLYAGYTLGAFVGPMLAANAVSRTGSYGPAFLVAAALAFSALILVAVAKVLADRRFAAMGS